MAFTRAQATALLNTSEMRLFDDSRANALRGLDRTALAGRIERTRAARDRARDLLKRQKLAARKRGDARDAVAARTARKEALLVELLERFTEARRQAPAAAVARKNAAARKPATSTEQARVNKATAKKVAVKKAGAKTAAAKETTAKKATMTKAAAKKATAKKAAAKKPAAKRAAAEKAVTRTGPGTSTGTGSRPRSNAGRRTPAGASARLTPEQALEVTRRLLEEKQAQAREPKPWQAVEAGAGQVPSAGYQSPQAAEKAHHLHAGEARMASTHGSSSTRDRRSQGQRDHRSDTE